MAPAGNQGVVRSDKYNLLISRILQVKFLFSDGGSDAVKCYGVANAKMFDQIYIDMSCAVEINLQQNVASETNALWISGKI